MIIVLEDIEKYYARPFFAMSKSSGLVGVEGRSTWEL
jgi:hypothetical protein